MRAVTARVGSAQGAVLTFAAISVWTSSAWVASLLDVELAHVRGFLLAVMLVSLFLTTSIVGAFEDRAWIFASAYVCTTIGRPLFVVLGPMRRAFRMPFLRALAWACVTGPVWIVGAIIGGTGSSSCGPRPSPSSSSSAGTAIPYPDAPAARRPTTTRSRSSTWPSARGCPS